MLQKLEDILGKGRVEENKSLSQFLTLRTDTIWEYFFVAKSREDLINAKKASFNLSIPLLLLGGGSNVAVCSKAVIGLVVKNNYIHRETIEENEKSIIFSVSSGYPMPLLVRETVEEGIEGFEYHKGLPGTIGGAIAMNSKWTKPISYVSANMVYAYLIEPNGSIKKADHAYFSFRYDYSTLKKTREILLEIVFGCKKNDPYILETRSNEALQYRLNSQVHGAATCGCFFQNISEETRLAHQLPTTSAGYLIERAGLKNFSVGDFYISGKHANFIVNCGNGRPDDLVQLLDTVKQKVKEKFGIELEEEVQLI